MHGATRRMLLATRAIAEALFSTEAGAPPEARVDWLLGELDDFLGRAGTRARGLMRLSVLAVSLLAPLFVLRVGPLRRLPLPLRVVALERFERSKIGLSLLAVKAILCIIYYEHPDAARAIGFDGACMLQGGR